MIYVPSEKLAENFLMREVVRSDTADRLEIDNTPSADELENAKLFAEKILQPIRDHYGIGYSPQSWFRSEALEKIVCAKSYPAWCAKRSLLVGDITWNKYFSRKSHPTGGCSDIEIPGVPNDELYEWIKTNLEFDQLIREFRKPDDPRSGWVHVSFREEGNRNQAFAIG